MDSKINQEGLMQTTFNVPSISCSICSNKIQEGIKSLNGINSVTVDLKTQSVSVDYNPSDIQPQEIRRKVSSMGYELVQ